MATKMDTGVRRYDERGETTAVNLDSRFRGKDGNKRFEFEPKVF